MTNNVGAVRVAPTSVGTGAPSDINYNAAGNEGVYAMGLQFDSADVGVTSYIPTRGSIFNRAEDVLKILRQDGTYDIEIVRQNGTELLSRSRAACTRSQLAYLPSSKS
jgi:hypothetical protein